MAGCVSTRQQALLDWWRVEGRHDLPWRATRDPWAIAVSELMLQQTQVARVVPRFGGFLARFPTAASCAAATPGEIVQMWSGLGYNRRALNLHGMASACVARHGGHLPDSLPDLLALPGIGPYTARAILAFAHGVDVGVVDTNVGRVLARWRGERLTVVQAQAAADLDVPVGRGWEWNQAMFDLGAGVCTRRSPVCESCPVSSWCAWAGTGGVDPATGSAGVSMGQSRFAGSDRQGRGRLVEALRQGPVRRDGVAFAAGWPDDAGRADRVLAGLVRDGLAVEDEVWVRLP